MTVTTLNIATMRLFSWEADLYFAWRRIHHYWKYNTPTSMYTKYFVALDKLSTLCSNSVQFHYILLQFSIKFEQECNNNFIIALLLGLQCNNNLLLHSCSNFIQNQCLINETNTTLPTVPTLKIFWLSIKSCIARFYLSKSETIFE